MKFGNFEILMAAIVVLTMIAVVTIFLVVPPGDQDPRGGILTNLRAIRVEVERQSETLERIEEILLLERAP